MTKKNEGRFGRQAQSSVHTALKSSLDKALSTQAVLISYLVNVICGYLQFPEIGKKTISLILSGPILLIFSGIHQLGTSPSHIIIQSSTWRTWK